MKVILAQGFCTAAIALHFLSSSSEAVSTFTSPRSSKQATRTVTKCINSQLLPEVLSQSRSTNNETDIQPMYLLETLHTESGYAAYPTRKVLVK